MDSHESPKESNTGQPVRTLKIEADGDYFNGRIKPKIRLMGQWLERAGFRPGNHVHVTCVTPGMIELRSADALMEESKPASSDQSEQPF
jgi:hypothetical protein